MSRGKGPAVFGDPRRCTWKCGEEGQAAPWWGWLPGAKGVRAFLDLEIFECLVNVMPAGFPGCKNALLAPSSCLSHEYLHKVRIRSLKWLCDDFSHPLHHGWKVLLV